VSALDVGEIVDQLLVSLEVALGSGALRVHVDGHVDEPGRRQARRKSNKARRRVRIRKCQRRCGITGRQTREENAAANPAIANAIAGEGAESIVERADGPITAGEISSRSNGFIAERIDLGRRHVQCPGINIAAEEMHFVGEVVVQTEGDVVVFDGSRRAGDKPGGIVSIHALQAGVIAGRVEFIQRLNRGADADATGIAQNAPIGSAGFGASKVILPDHSAGICKRENTILEVRGRNDVAHL